MCVCVCVYVYVYVYVCVCVCDTHLESQNKNILTMGWMVAFNQVFYCSFPLYKKLLSVHLHEARRCVFCRSHMQPRTPPPQQCKENGNQMGPGNNLHASIQSSFPGMALAVQW